LKLAYEATAYITERVRSAYPNAAKAIQSLHSMGFRLFTASNEHSRELDGYLTGMGIRQHFDTLYGSDLVNQGKYSVEYYRRVFNHAGVNAENALVVDDNLQNLAWAGSLGATTCLVSSSLPNGTPPDFVVSDLGDLPLALNRPL
jgi:HAD superfamily hydrolase (TIGR01509 family)